MKQIFTSIDIGSDTIKVVTLELFKGKFNLLAAYSSKSEGVKKGLIIDPILASKSISLAIKKVESMLGFKINKVITTVPSYLSEFSLIKGSINLETGKVTGHDVKDLINETVKSNLKPNVEVVNVLPIDFSVDDRDLIKDPKGLIGNTMSLRAIMTTVPSKNVYSVVTVLEGLGIEVKDISIGGISDIEIVNLPVINKGVGALINIGAELTTVSLYNKGIIVKNVVIGKGGSSIDNDLAYMYKININEAKNLKEKFVLGHKRRANHEDFIEITNNVNDVIKINQYETSEVVQARLEEIVNEVRLELDNMTDKKLSYIYVTGGTSNIKDFHYILEDFLDKSVIIGSIDMIGVRNNKYSTVIGNVVSFVERLNLKGINYSMLSEEEQLEISTVKKNLINVTEDGVLGKVFGYFFND